jgi:hypothetical protein
MASRACQPGNRDVHQPLIAGLHPSGVRLALSWASRGQRVCRVRIDPCPALGPHLSLQTPRPLISAFESSVRSHSNVSLQDPCRISTDHAPGRDITEDNRSCRDDALVADRYSRADQTAPSNEATLAYFDRTIRSGDPIVRQDETFEGHICLAADLDGTLRPADESTSHRNVDRVVELNTESPTEMPLSHRDGE